MEVVVVTPPAPFISLDEAKKHLRIEDNNDSDEIIKIYIAAVCGALEGPMGRLGRAIGQQVLQVVLDEFPDASCALPFRLPVPQLISIDEVGYVDGNGADQTFDEADYRAIWVGTERGSLDLAYGGAWPSIRSQSGAVSITYTAGYATIPAAIKAAALLMLGDLFENRETAAVGVSGVVLAIPMSTTVDALLAPFRVWVA